MSGISAFFFFWTRDQQIVTTTIVSSGLSRKSFRTREVLEPKKTNLWMF